MSMPNDDTSSQSSKKHKSKRRNYFSRLFLRKSRNYKAEEGNEGNAFPGTSSISGDSRSLSISSKGDVLTVPISPSESAPASLKHEAKGSIKREGSQSGSTTIECPLCLTTQQSENFPSLMTCHHRSCADCLLQYLTIEITESRVNLMCPECHERLHPVDMRNILKSSPHLIEKWEEFTLRRCLSVDPDCRWCPAPDCGYAVIAYGCASCPKIHCERPGCGTEFCYHCRQEWHPNQTCDAAHLKRRKELRIQSDSLNCQNGSNISDFIKPCPKCGALIAKMNDGSCNHMTCTVCEAEFCWLCLQEITDLHYLSPSGCTFWGKKPWSRKKKLLWQFGLIIGAPLGIGLVAVVAIPAIIIGLPIWVARRIIAHFAKKSFPHKVKRNTSVVAGVIVSIMVSPLLAALAVGVGVPVMLLYVYGVVPFSICRTGGYGMTARTAANRARNAMRIDIGSPVIPASKNTNSSDAPVHHSATNLITNPSIGEASVGGMTMTSLSLSHGSMDHNERDGDSASTTAIAGASITGSLSSSVATASAIYGRKDIDQQSIHTHVSVSSGNYTSAQVHISDNVPDHVNSSSSGNHVQFSTGTSTSKSYSSIGAKRKTSKNKIARKTTVPKKIHEHDENKGYNDHMAGDNDRTAQEIEKAVNAILMKSEDTSSTGSNASSCGSQHALLASSSGATATTSVPCATIEICNETMKEYQV